MDSSLRPRDIQARIRAGASPEEVAQAAGVPLERIDAFAAPVLAERDYLCGLARTNPVRRRGETTSHRALRNAVADALAARGIDIDAAQWDAWKLEDRRWQVRVTFPAGGHTSEGLFVFDTMGRFSVAANDEARALIGDAGTDQLALVEATLGSAPDAATAAGDALPTTTPGEAEEDPSAEDADDTEDAYHDGDLAEVDGVYDLLPPDRGELDVLYDMLSSFDEDSVKIYAGLVHPKEAAGDVEAVVIEQERTVEVEVVVAPAADAEPRADAGAVPEAGSAEGEDAATPPPGEPEQLSLLEEETAPEPSPRPRPRTRRKRASVPSWDEIMFGAPHPRDEG